MGRAMTADQRRRRDARLVSLLQSGLTVREAARAVKVSRQRAYKILEQRGDVVRQLSMAR